MAKRKQVTLVIFPDLLAGSKKLNDTQFGVLMRGMLSYRFEGKEAEFDDPMVALCFDFLKPQLQRYDEICEINRLNRNKRKTEVQDDASVCDEVPRKTTESSKSKRKATQNQTQIQTQTQTQTQVQSQNQKKKESKKEISADKPPAKTIPPTVEQVRQYCLDKGIGIDPQRFVDYYTANGWMVGRTKMKDWTAAVRTWNSKELGNGKTELQPLWTVGTVL